MKNLLIILILMTFVYCSDDKSSKNNTSLATKSKSDSTMTERKEKQLARYTDKQLENFLDSIGKLSPTPFMDKASFMTDSIFKNQKQLDVTINLNDFSKLKQGCKVEKLDLKTAKRIFGNIQIDSSYESAGIIPLTFVSFDNDKADFKEFAVCPGYANAGESCEMYFFSANKIISKHEIYHRYGLELNHYKDVDGKTVIYYKENYQSGSGIWWFNFYFYKYYNNKLIPILNELENGIYNIPEHPCFLA